MTFVWWNINFKPDTMQLSVEVYSTRGADVGCHHQIAGFVKSKPGDNARSPADQPARRLTVVGDQAGQVQTGQLAIDDPPAACHHHSIGMVSTAQQ